MSIIEELAEKNGVDLSEPSPEEKTEAQALYTAIMTDTLLEDINE